MVQTHGHGFHDLQLMKYTWTSVLHLLVLTLPCHSSARHIHAYLQTSTPLLTSLAMLAGAKPIHKATIMPRGNALGMVSQLPDQDEFSTSRAQIRADIDVCMGGRVAEELVYGADQVGD